MLNMKLVLMDGLLFLLDSPCLKDNAASAAGVLLLTLPIAKSRLFCSICCSA
jgi:hypothetical protein